MIYVLEIFLVVKGISNLSPTRLIEALAVDPAGTFIVLAGRFFAALFIHLILSLIDTWTTFAVVVKRLHDTDRSGWWFLGWAGVYLIGMLTVAFIIGWFIWILVWLGFQEGTPGRNHDGEPTS